MNNRNNVYNRNIIWIFKNRKSKEVKNMINVFDVAKAFLYMESMTPKKLQKLCYYAQSWSLALEEKKLFNDDFEAWVHGPVCRELYSEYKNYGYFEIPQEYEKPANIDKVTMKFLGRVYDTYGEFSGDQLEYLTHLEKPWLEARGNIEEWEPSRNIINNETIKEYYRKLYDEENN